MADVSMVEAEVEVEETQVDAKDEGVRAAMDESEGVQAATQNEGAQASKGDAAKGDEGQTAAGDAAEDEGEQADCGHGHVHAQVLFDTHREDLMRRQIYWLREISKWNQQVSLHLSHMENRAMEAEYEGHEVVRQFGNMLEAFVPPPRGDWGWMLRRIRDCAVRALRQLKKMYGDERQVGVRRSYEGEMRP